MGTARSAGTEKGGERAASQRGGNRNTLHYDPDSSQAIFPGIAVVTVYAIVRLVMWKQLKQAWFKKCHFRVTPEIDRALTVRGFLVLGVTLI